MTQVGAVLTRPAVPFLVPALTRRADLVLRLTVILWCAGTAYFWSWWLSPVASDGWRVGRALTTLLLSWVFVQAGYFLFFACRMTRPNPRTPLPDVRVAMVVTKAPAEPWELLQKTLLGMLRQDYPGSYEVWLADERPTARTRHWCAQHGVQVSSREGDPAYDNATWPRRRRTKEGNLAYFYDKHGYERYDVVAQFDSDHVPAPGYLSAVVRPFADPRIGYVAAPSVDDANTDQGWTTRGRLFKEASLHGAVQAGSNGGWAPVCIGSHYAVRTAALREVGGLGPELAEDYATTLWLQSAGWDGAFALDAEAHGEGPTCLDDLLLQERQWAQSLGTILVRWAPGKLGGVAWRARVRLLIALVFYLVQGLLLVLGTVLAPVAVTLQTSWVDTSFAAFYLHLWPCSLALLAAVTLVRRQGLLRPVDAPLVSWEVMLFQVVRWPVTIWGFLRGMLAGARRSTSGFRVTPKRRGAVRPLRWTSLAPTLGIGAGSAAAVALVPDPGEALGFYLLASAQALVYFEVAIAAVLLHLLAGRRLSRDGSSSTWAGVGGAALLTAAVAVPGTALVLWRLAGLG